MKTLDRHYALGKYLATVIILLVMILLTSCAKPKTQDRPLNPIMDANLLGKAIACIFAPDTCKKADQDKAQPASK